MAGRWGSISVACASDCHWRRLMATTMTRRSSAVTKSRPKAPYMSLPMGGRPSWSTWAWAT